jgi:hypothetical protein
MKTDLNEEWRRRRGEMKPLIIGVPADESVMRIVPQIGVAP